jgi:ubiquinone/menaquinone biosynthesis C-methylase UbiE
MSSNDNFEYVECNLCGLSSSNIVFVGKDIKYKTGLFSVVKCKKCGLVYTNPRPVQKIMANYYPNEYWEMEEVNNIRTFEKTLKKAAHNFINKISYKVKVPPKRDGKILDIGCGDGSGLLKLKKEGWKTYGVEISDIAAKYAREKCELNVYTGTVEDAEFADDYFDRVILSHVVEHLHDPKSTLKEVNRILKKDGILIICIPNVYSVEAKIFKKYWIGWDLPRHLYHYSPITISSLLYKTGFNVLKIEYDNNPNNMLSSLQYVLIDHHINPIIGLVFLYPFVNLASIILAKSKKSDSMVIYCKKNIDY